MQEYPTAIVVLDDSRRVSLAPALVKGRCDGCAFHLPDVGDCGAWELPETESIFMRTTCSRAGVDGIWVENEDAPGGERS